MTVMLENLMVKDTTTKQKQQKQHLVNDKHEEIETQVLSVLLIAYLRGREVENDRFSEGRKFPS